MGHKVIGIGEVLWDLLPSGPQLGGAPVNFACHAVQLGAEAQVITRVGNDSHGRRVLQRFQEMHINADTVQVDDRLPTGTATVMLDSSGSPQFTIQDNVAWDALCFTDAAMGAVQKANAICFGTLAQRNKPAAALIQRLVASTPFSALRVFDVNLRQKFYTTEVVEQSFELANVVKLNDDELTVLAPMFGLRGSAKQQVGQLARQFDLQVVALTRGGKGSLLHQMGTWSELDGSPIEVVDTVGAGDAFTAALVLGLLNRFGLEDIHRVAVDVASYVCSRPGATPELPKYLRATFAESSTNA